MKRCLLIVARDLKRKIKKKKVRAKGRRKCVSEGHHHSSRMLCGAAVVCLCESEPAPWCCREAVVEQSSMFVRGNSRVS